MRLPEERGWWLGSRSQALHWEPSLRCSADATSVAGLGGCLKAPAEGTDDNQVLAHYAGIGPRLPVGWVASQNILKLLWL